MVARRLQVKAQAAKRDGRLSHLNYSRQRAGDLVAQTIGERYRVLRGGSWATSPRVKTTTFRNWDLPERRQIFAGVRLARDAA